MVVQNTLAANIEDDGDHNNVEAGEGVYNGHNGRLGEANGGPRSDQGSDAENEPEENDLIRWEMEKGCIKLNGESRHY